MPIIFHVDRSKSLSSGDVVELIRHTDIEPDYLQAHMDEMFPEGVSSHGERYFVKYVPIGDTQDPANELVCEYVRRSHFVERPSRFESLFAFRNLVDAEAFRASKGPTDARIYEIECEDTFFADLNLLRLVGCSALEASFFAHEYWGGHEGAPYFGAPVWEALVRPPVVVGGRVS